MGGGIGFGGLGGELFDAAGFAGGVDVAGLVEHRLGGVCAFP